MSIESSSAPNLLNDSPSMEVDGEESSTATTTPNDSASNKNGSQPANGTEQMPKTAGQPLVDFLQYLEDYKPSIPDSVTAHYMNSAGFAATDSKVSRLVAIASQKFIADIANDALQHCKMRTALNQSKKITKDKRYTLTAEDLTPVLTEYGINVKKPQYFN